MARNSSASKQAALVDQINRYWGWTGLNAAEVVGRNEFGNFLVLDKDGTFWRICPEQLACDIVADTPAEFESLINDPEFNLDWQMSAIVEIARKKFGPQKVGWVYYLVIPDLFGGLYDEVNIQTVPINQLIAHSGEWAFAIKDLPEGGQIRLRVID